MPISEEDRKNARRRIPSKYHLRGEGLKITAPRIAILDLFRQSRTPLCAEDIMSSMPEMKISTIYRVLKFLEEMGVITSAKASAEAAVTAPRAAGTRKRRYYEFK